MTTRIYCIRHGETTWNAAGRWQGRAPVPLNEIGLAQAKLLGRYLAAQGTKFTALYSSDLPRAMQTAQALAELLQLRVQPEPRLRETDLGVWQGLTRTEIKAWDGERYAAYVTDRRRISTPDGESWNDVKTRVRAAFDDVSQRHAGQTIVLVSHGGALSRLLGSLFDSIEHLSLDNTSITIVEQPSPGAEWQLGRTSWTPHLAEKALGETEETGKLSMVP